MTGSDLRRRRRCRLERLQPVWNSASLRDDGVVAQHCVKAQATNDESEGEFCTCRNASNPRAEPESVNPAPLLARRLSIPLSPTCSPATCKSAVGPLCAVAVTASSDNEPNRLERSMPNDPFAKAFLSALDTWVCGGFSCDIRYCAEADDEGGTIWHASIGLHPLPPPADHRSRLVAGTFLFGQHQATDTSTIALIELMCNAVTGHIAIPGGPHLELSSGADLSYFSENCTSRPVELGLAPSGLWAHSDRTICFCFSPCVKRIAYGYASV